jgi:hypothetical protein
MANINFRAVERYRQQQQPHAVIENPERALAVRTAQVLQLMEQFDAPGNRPTLVRKHNAPAVSSPNPYVHGAGGLLSYPGILQQVFSTAVGPGPGMAGALPILDDIVVTDTDGRFGGAGAVFMTILGPQTAGELDDWSNQPDSVCVDAPAAGFLTACTQLNPYGEFRGRTETLSRRRVGYANNWAEQLNAQLMNIPLNNDPLVPVETRESAGGTWINDELRARLFTLGIAFQRLIRPLVWTGNPANNMTPAGSRQFQGENLLINTGKVDVGGDTCPGIDSVIIDFNNTDVGSADATGTYIYQYIDRVDRYFMNFAEEAGLMPATWALSMREDLFWRLTEIWQVQQYLQYFLQLQTINIGTDTGGRINMSAQDVLAARDDMRRNLVLPVNGRLMPVVVDNAIPVTVGAGGVLTSQIALVCMDVLGGVPAHYWNFFNYDNAAGRLMDEYGRGLTRTGDGGRTLWVTSMLNGCMALDVTMGPRLMQHTPFLCARIVDVNYNPGIASRGWAPGQPNFYTLPETGYNLPAVYTDWSPTTLVVPGPSA